jgi:hypothetical protein
MHREAMTDVSKPVARGVLQCITCHAARLSRFGTSSNRPSQIDSRRALLDHLEHVRRIGLIGQTVGDERVCVRRVEVGDCYDNAMIEAFWSRMQVELLDTRRWKTRVKLANALFEYNEIFHNRCRRHSALGMRTPIEYELLNTTPAAA